ncbi:MAG: membrane integrity-associated transporter subunit PqiC [Nitrosomonas sp.]|nr:membrane integrity-associated transporter subunit PqiC [Nitrosomonas sp.]
MIPIFLVCRRLVILVTLLLGGCANTPTYTFYTLSTMQAVDPTAQAVYRSDDAAISVNLVAFPSYLDRPQIVTRPTANTLAIHEFRRWGGSLEADFLRILGENLSILLDTQRIFLPRQNVPFNIDYRVAIDVNRFDGNLGGQIVLDVDWMIITQENKERVVIRKSVIRETVDSQDYESLVSAKSQAIEKLSREIADAFREIQSN